VDAETSRSPEIEERVQAEKALGARRHLALAWSFARAGGPGAVVLLSGPSGSGKSVLASQIAPWLDAEVIRSDVVRKRMAGLAETERPAGAEREALYAAEMSERTYAALLEAGLEVALAGRVALLDATYLLAGARARVLSAARLRGLPCALLCLECPEAVIRERLRRRGLEGKDASDADLEVYREQVRSAEALDEAERRRAVAFRPGDAPEEALMRLLDLLEASERGAPST
jgi:predicted kinase